MKALVTVLCVGLGVGGALGCAGRAPTTDNKPSVVETELAEAQARLQKSPRDADLQRETGLLFWMNGDPVQAERLLVAALEARPGDARTQLALATLFDDAMRDAEARAAYQRLLELADWQPEDLWSRAGAIQSARRVPLWADEDAVGLAALLTRTADGKVAPRVREAVLRALSRVTEPLADPEADPAAAAAADTVALRRGCVPRWLAHEPRRFGHLRLLAPASGPPTQENASGRLVAPRCEAVLRSPDGRAGRHVLTTWIVAGEAREVELELEVPDVDVLARLWIGSALVVGRDTAKRFLPARSVARVQLPKGASPVALEVALLGGDVHVGVRVRDPKTGARPANVRFVDDPAAAPKAPAAQGARFVGVVTPDLQLPVRTVGDELLATFLTGYAALGRGDSETADEATTRLVEAAPRWTSARALEARVVAAAPARPAAVARDRARGILAETLRRDPSAWRLRLALADLTLREGDANTALEILGAAPPAGDRLFRVALTRARALDEKQLPAEADRALSAAERLAPKACSVREARHERETRRGSPAARRAAAQALASCDADRDAWARSLEDGGEHAAAIEERERLARRRPDDPSVWLAAGMALDAAGRRDTAVARFEKALGLAPRWTDARLALADLHAAVGDVAGARSILEDGLALDPGSADLLQALVAMGGSDPLARWRIDGRQVIDAFEKDEKGGRAPYDAPAVLVLDRTVVVVLASGARRTLTHNIVKVLQKDGLDRWGEVRVPDGAELLMARTVKRDGSTREPETLAKEGLTVPDLSVGDYVEFEYVEAEAPSRIHPEGFIGDRFYFGTMEAPLDRTELVVVAPVDMDLVLDRRGPAPSPKVVTDGGLRITTFADRHKAQLAPEPGGPPLAESLPSVLPLSHVTLDSWRAWLVEQTYGARRVDRSVRAQAAALTAGAKTDLARARALYDFVTTEIAGSSSLVEEPALILARRRGNRAVLLCALARAAGLPAELWVARGRQSGEGDPSAPDLSSLADPVVRLGIAAPAPLGHDGGVFLDPSFDHAPFGWLGPELRGAPALRLPDPETASARDFAPRKTLARLPSTTVVGDRGTSTLDAKLAADGSAVVVQTDVFVGRAAVYWRELLKRTPRAELTQGLEERVLGIYFPGVEVQAFEVEGEKDREAPLTLRYRYHVPRFARVGEGGVLELRTTPEPSYLARRTVAMSARTTPLVLLETHEESTTTLRVTLPEGWQVAAPLPPAAQASAPDRLGTFTQSVSTKDGLVVATTRLALQPYGRVAPARYGDFVRFAGQVDAAESRPIVLRPPTRRASAPSR